MSSIVWNKHTPITISEASTAREKGREKLGGVNIGRDARRELRSRNAVSESSSQTNLVPLRSKFVKHAERIVWQKLAEPAKPKNDTSCLRLVGRGKFNKVCTFAFRGATLPSPTV